MSNSMTSNWPHEDTGEDQAVHAWRVWQLTRLGLAWPAVDAVAGQVDWHEVAKLVQRGCPAALAVTIAQ